MCQQGCEFFVVATNWWESTLFTHSLRTLGKLQVTWCLWKSKLHNRGNLNQKMTEMQFWAFWIFSHENGSYLFSALVTNQPRVLMKVGDFPIKDFGDPPPSKSDKTHYWTFIANLCGRHRLFCVRAPLRAQGSFVTFWGGGEGGGSPKSSLGKTRAP